MLKKLNSLWGFQLNQAERIYRGFLDCPDLTASELCSLLEIDTPGVSGATGGRVTELLQAGALRVTGKRKCSITGKPARTLSANPEPWVPVGRSNATAAMRNALAMIRSEMYSEAEQVLESFLTSDL